MLLLTSLACTPWSSSTDMTCWGAYGSTEFLVVVHSVQASPLDPGINYWTGQRYETWDWDGDVPDDWVQASADLAEALEFVKDIFPSKEAVALSEFASLTAEVLAATDEHAPYLLADFVEPELDVGFIFWRGEDDYDELGWTGTLAEDSLAVQGIGVGVESFFSGPDDALVLPAWDVDLVADDWVGQVVIDHELAQEVAGCGPVLLDGSDGLFRMQVEVSALD